MYASRIISVISFTAMTALPVSAQQLDLFGDAATTTMTNTATGLFTQQSVGEGNVTATLATAADAAGNIGLLTSATSATTSTYTDSAGQDYLVTTNGGMVSIANSASTVMNQFVSDGTTISALLGAGVTLANGEIAVSQQALAEGDATATMNLPEMASGGAIANVQLTNSAIGAGNAISLPTTPLNP